MAFELIELDPRERFAQFFKSFQTSDGEYKYRRRLSQMAITGQKSLLIDFEDLMKFDHELAESLIEKPSRYIEAASHAVGDVMKIINLNYARKVREFRARFRRLPELTPLRKIRAEHLGRLIMIEGILTRASSVKQQLVVGVFECPKCGNIMKVERRESEGRVNPPERCTNPDCKYRGNFTLLIEDSIFMDWQRLTIQEKPEELPPGQLPRSIDAIARGDIVDIARPGDRVIVVGILKPRPEFTPRGRLSTYRPILEINSIDVAEKGLEEIEITPEDEEIIKELAKDPFIHRKIIQSIAPSIFGYEEIKEGIAYLLFGGVPKQLPDGVRIRGDINILLVGDPGTAKSQILQYVARIAPRGIYTSGKGSTAAGLTAAVVRDKLTGDYYLEAGALVLADGGVACVDEIDKMRSEDRVAMHEAMEQQSYHPSFEITLADGAKIKIGELVDKLFEKFQERKIIGINCEILPISDLNIEILTTNFNTIFKTKINRVSRHRAPDKFIKITYSNGREIIVTPEHPVFIFKEGEIKTIRADKLKAGTFVPAVRKIEFKGVDKLNTEVARERKRVKLPQVIRIPAARFLGYFVTEGYAYNVTGNEIGLSNTNQEIISKMKPSIQETFGLKPIDYTDKNRTLRIISKTVYNYMSKNFPEVMKPSKFRRIPQKIFTLQEKERIEFLKAAFEGDGSIESEALAYTTSSRGLAEDYQDLLLTLGIHSRIIKENYTLRNGEQRQRFKVYITGDSLRKFVETIIPEYIMKDDVRKLMERSKGRNRKHDVLPPYTAKMIIVCLKKLGLPYSGYFHRHLKMNHEITIEVINKYLETIKHRIRECENAVRKITNFKELRQKLGYSQSKVAKLIGVTRSSIDYLERGGYNLEKRGKMLERFKKEALKEIEHTKEIVEKIERLKRVRWLRIKRIEILENRNELETRWVYDVTVEPTRNFISHGLILHNTVSIAKAGIVATLNARTAILAAANPALGRFVEQKSIAENVNLPITILSRFDLIFTIKDKPDPRLDEQMSDHILKLHQTRGYVGSPPIPPDLLKKYISYARKNIVPRLTLEAAERIRKFYLEMRSLGRESETATIPITPRQLEALVRMAEARAKMALREEVTVDDAEAAIRLMRYVLERTAIDRETGRIDIDTIMTGKPLSQRERLMKLIDIIREKVKEIGGAVKIEEIVEAAEEAGLDKKFVQIAIDRMLREGLLYEQRPGYIMPT